jgi:hypothetical protein
MAFFRPKTSKTSATPAEISGGHQRLHSRTANVSGPLDELMARRAWSLLREMRDADPVGYREMFSNFIPLDAPPSEVYSDRQLEVIYGAVCRGLARRAARIATRLH